MSYHAEIHRIMDLGRERGVPAALAESTHSSTVFLPNAIAACLSRIATPSRAIGIWIQIAELFAVLISLFYYLTHIKRQSYAAGLLMVAPLLALAALHRSGGGISDFRMDLSLCLTFALTAIWYLAALETSQLRMFVLFGLSAGIACLFRATAPAYFIVSFGPLVAIDLALSHQRRRLAIGLAVAVAIAAAVSLWFYVLNFQSLRHYYFVWNIDANANLPLRESIKHVGFAAGHVGGWAVGMILLHHALVFAERFAAGGAAPGSSPGSGAGLLAIARKARFDRLNFRLVWLAAAPTVMLVARGAGLNPYVCMPSAIGVVLFLSFPWGVPQTQISQRTLAASALASTLLLGLAAREGWRAHRGPDVDSMASHRQILDTMINDAEARQSASATYAALHVNGVNASSLENVLLFDTPEVTTAVNAIACRGIEIVHCQATTVHAEADWQRIAGDSENEKLQAILAELTDRVDYLVMPTEPTARFLEKHVRHVEINRHCLALRTQLLRSGNWIPISAEIANSPEESVVVYRRAASAPPLATNPESAVASLR